MPTRPDSRRHLRGCCPGCGRTDVVLLPPRLADRRPPKPWRRKEHAVQGDIGTRGAVRCRYPTELTPDEISTLEEP